MSQEKKKRPEQIYAGDKSFPAKPSTWDYVKEAFEPTATRAEIDAVRKRRAKSGV